jgi:peptidyl-prolyl cis-trans isomerase D
VERGTLPAEIDDVIFGLPAGEISEPVASPAGYHLFQVLEVIPEGPPPRSEVEASVRSDLAENRARDVTRECVEKLAGEVGVVLYRDHLWFRYQGRYGESERDSSL